MNHKKLITFITFFSFLATAILPDFAFPISLKRYLRPPQGVMKKMKDDNYMNMLKIQEDIKGIKLKISKESETLSIEKIYSEQGWLFGDYLGTMGGEIKDEPIVVLEIRFNGLIAYLILDGNHRVYRAKKDGKKTIKALVIRPRFKDDVIIEKKISDKGRKLFTMDEMTVYQPITTAILPKNEKSGQIDQDEINRYFERWIKEISVYQMTRPNYKRINRIYYLDESKLSAFKVYLSRSLAENKSNLFSIVSIFLLVPFLSVIGEPNNPEFSESKNIFAGIENKKLFLQAI